MIIMYTWVLIQDTFCIIMSRWKRIETHLNACRNNCKAYDNISAKLGSDDKYRVMNAYGVLPIVTRTGLMWVFSVSCVM